MIWPLSSSRQSFAVFSGTHALQRLLLQAKYNRPQPDEGTLTLSGPLVTYTRLLRPATARVGFTGWEQREGQWVYVRRYTAAMARWLDGCVVRNASALPPATELACAVSEATRLLTVDLFTAELEALAGEGPAFEVEVWDDGLFVELI